MADCLFCGIVEGSIPSQQVDSDELTGSFMDINPATPGHALVIPRAHSADLLEISPDDLKATTVAAQRLAKRAKDVLNADGINLVNACGAAAFQTVFHFHIHVVPRYEDDPLKLPWVPTEGDPDEIAEIAAKLREED
jgi:histidine triad (HIT) family protein